MRKINDILWEVLVPVGTICIILNQKKIGVVLMMVAIANCFLKRENEGKLVYIARVVVGTIGEILVFCIGFLKL